MNNKNFIFFISSLGSGGAERQLTYLANFLISKGHDVSIYVLTRPGVEPFYALDERVKYISLDLKALNKNILVRLFLLVKKIIVFNRIIRKSRKDSVILSFMDVMNMICIVSSLFSFKKVHVAERSDPFHQPASKVVRKIIDFSYFFSKSIFVQSNKVAEYFSSYSSKVKVVFNAIDLKVNEFVKNKVSNSNSLEFISVARLSAEKGVVFLVELFLEVEREFPNIGVKLKLYGDGVFRESIVGQIEDSKVISYMGRSSEIHKEMFKADMLVLASDYEGFPNVVLESLAVGTPVLSTPSAGACQIDDVLNAESLKLMARDEFKSYIIDLIEKEGIPNVDQACLQSIHQNFSVEFVMSQWERGLS